eukprot:6204959-Pleurochrysis_carterae.AAC.2
MSTTRKDELKGIGRRLLALSPLAEEWGGDDGDFFYVVDSGAFDCFVKDKEDAAEGLGALVRLLCYVCPLSSFASMPLGALVWNLSFSQVPSCFLRRPTYYPRYPVYLMWGCVLLNCWVTQYGPKTTFGELALMYNAPRAASIIATADSTVWAMERNTFRKVLVAHTSTTLLQLSSVCQSMAGTH